MQTFKWQKRDDGGVELRTETLHLIVSPREGGGWLWVVFNSGHYRAPRQGDAPAGSDMAYAKTLCKAAALNLLRDEEAQLECIGVN